MPDMIGPYTKIRSEFNVAVAMRDGVTLYADVYRPDADGPLPVLLQRTPYDKTQNRTGSLDVMRAASHGYAVVVQDTRGSYASEGEFYPFLDEPNDGYDTVQWCAEQPWSSGKVGMFGRSYVGATQWLCAITNPPGPHVHRAGHYSVGLLRGLDLPGRRAGLGLCPVVDDAAADHGQPGRAFQPTRRARRDTRGIAGGVQRAGLYLPSPTHRGPAAPQRTAGRLLLRLDPPFVQRRLLEPLAD